MKRGYYLLAAVLLLATVWSIRLVNDIDVQWHLKVGGWMLENQQVVSEDFYSVSRWGKEWTSIPWLYQCTLAWLVEHVGWIGPTLWQWLTALLITLQSSLLIYLYRRPGQWDWRWPALSVTAALGLLHVLQVTEIRFQHRPEMISHVLIPFFILLLTLYTKRENSIGTDAPWVARTGRRLQRGWIWLLPLLQVIWANSHGVFALGPILVWTYIGAGWLTALPGRQTASQARQLVQLTLVGLAVVGACFVTPYGWKSALYPVHLLYVLTAPVYKYGIAEAVPVSIKGMWQAGGLNLLILTAWLLAGVGLTGRIVQLSRSAAALKKGVQGWLQLFQAEIGLGYLAVCGGLFYISLTAVRNIPLFSLVAVPLMVNGLEYTSDFFHWCCGRLFMVLQGLRWGSGSQTTENVPCLSTRSLRFFSLMSTLLLFGLMAVLYRAIVSERYYQWQHRPTRFAIGQSDHTFPLAACDFLEKQLPRMGTTAMFGDTKSADIFLNRFGPKQKTYLDGRHAEVYDAPIFTRYGEALGVRGVFFSEAGKYGIGLAMFSVADMMVGSGDLQRDIYRHPGWALIYLDDCGVVFAARTPANKEVIDQYALPQAPTAMDEQEDLYQDWLRRTGRSNYSLYEQSNAAMNEGMVTGAMVRVLQLSGLWAPVRNRPAWNMARTAALLSKLGWLAVADNIYKELLTTSPLNASAAEEGINHAIACFEACATPDAQSLYLKRIRKRSELLLDQVADHPTAQYGLAYVEMKNNHPQKSLDLLTRLKKQRTDVVILDMIARLQGELGDLAFGREAKEALWKDAVHSWRERLNKYPSGPKTYRAYLRLGDLFSRIDKPLLARANYLNGLNEPDIPPEVALLTREHVQRLEMKLFGGSFVPEPGQKIDKTNPFIPPADMQGMYQQSPTGAQRGIPIGSRLVPGTALPSGQQNTQAGFSNTPLQNGRPESREQIEPTQLLKLQE